MLVFRGVIPSIPWTIKVFPLLAWRLQNGKIQIWRKVSSCFVCWGTTWTVSTAVTQSRDMSREILWWSMIEFSRWWVFTNPWMKNICSRQIGKIPQVGIKIFQKHLKPRPIVLLTPSLNSFLCWGPFWPHCSTQNSNRPPHRFIPNVTPNTSNWGEKHRIYTWRFLPLTRRRQGFSFWRYKIHLKKIVLRKSHQSLQWYL